MKKYFLSIVSALVVALFFTVFYAYSATTISTNISTGGTLSATGATTLSSTLAVTGASTFTGAVWASSTMQVTGASIFYAAATFNEDSADVDFRVESNGQANMLFVDAGNDRVSVGSTTPGAQFSVGTTAAATSTIMMGRFCQYACDSTGSCYWIQLDPTGAAVFATTTNACND